MYRGLLHNNVAAYLMYSKTTVRFVVEKSIINEYIIKERRFGSKSKCPKCIERNLIRMRSKGMKQTFSGDQSTN